VWPFFTASWSPGQVVGFAPGRAWSVGPRYQEAGNLRARSLCSSFRVLQETVRTPLSKSLMCPINVYCTPFTVLHFVNHAKSAAGRTRCRRLLFSSNVMNSSAGVRNDGCLEWREYNGHLYGIRNAAFVHRRIATRRFGRDKMKPEVNGALAIKERYPGRLLEARRTEPTSRSPRV
jgi:hypothetical protein